jgi:hypothetical protein
LPPFAEESWALAYRPPPPPPIATTVENDEFVPEPPAPPETFKPPDPTVTFIIDPGVTDKVPFNTPPPPPPPAFPAVDPPPAPPPATTTYHIFDTFWGIVHVFVPVAFHITRLFAPFVAVQQPLELVQDTADTEDKSRRVANKIIKTHL